MLSTICSELYGLTPVINNEVINKEEPTTVATNSRNKLIAGLLRTELEPNLGLSGSGQDVSIMRSTVLNTGIVVEQDGVVRLNLQPEDELLAGMLAVIESFVINARKNDGACFADLYKELTSAEQHIGLRKGLIPIYLSVVLHDMELPKYAKNAKSVAGKKVAKEYKLFLQEMRKNVGSYNLIFNAIPKIYGAETVNRELAEKVRMTKNYFDGALECLKNELSEKMRNMFCTLDTAACEKMSLPSIIRDWCEKLDQAAFEQLFTDGTDRCLVLFRDVTNDEDAFIAKAAKMATDLRLEDWDEDVISMFSGNMEQYRNTAESFHRTEETVSAAEITEDYELTYKDENGKAVTKRFAKVEESRRGKLLYNAIISQLDSMGQAIPEQEKRQILMEVLKEMC